VQVAASNGKSPDAADAVPAAYDNLLVDSRQGRLQHSHQEPQIQQEQQIVERQAQHAQQGQQQDCFSDEQAAAAGPCEEQQQQQQQQQRGIEACDFKPIGEQAAASAALLGATSSLCRQLPQAEILASPSRSSNASSSSSHPRAVFNRATGRAGVHQPLQLDSWRDWDAMAASMDEEGASGFGAWAAGHDD
jgi:hypothetical protein